ncbi:hypothetical protein OHB33_17385 [Streptomyces sp. NBC_01558]|uniref:hypothetical protein n=1 Tax=Streptomyces sp. NBC_01558 TaxID=2975878 RepID=UPI002DDB1F5E|nr:hypothetical protein [Streptomyces sp. NBC_01558]WSD77963.1 hypothetical protein OHB33_17385 [Streptomyces sp. NBC_01558]
MEPRKAADPTGPGGSERHGDDGSPGRRVADATGPGADAGGRVASRAGGGGRGVALGVRAAVGSLLAAAMRGRSDDGEAEAHAVAAFRAARDGGAHAAPTRRRDDWRHRRSAGATGTRGNAERPGDAGDAGETGEAANASDAGARDTATVPADAADAAEAATGRALGATAAAGVPRQAGDRTD